MPTTAAINNPFPAEAVVKYGASLTTCADIKYMQDAASQLHDYLNKYSDDSTRYGGAVGIKGRYGSGKTHLLNWLASEAENRKSLTVSTAYAKFDSASFFDLYRQILAKLDRTRLVELTMLARLEIARAYVRRAKATESLEQRLQTPDAIQELASEKNLDGEELTLELRNRLVETKLLPDELAQIILQLSDATLGADVFRWLSGDKVENPERFGINHQLAALPSGPDRTVDADTSAINALEMIARLHFLARVPFVLLFDQLETLVGNAPKERVESVSSLLKKLIEHLGRQNAYMAIAGTDDGWSPLTRDVGPRLRNRVPMTVGSLTKAETRIFLDAYTARDGMDRFADPIVTEIRQLSGGNPREILRIAYFAFKKSEGWLSKLSDQDILESAKDSETLTDREQEALRVCERVLAPFGEVGADLRGPKGEVINRTLTRDGSVVAAIRVAKATDQLHEVDVARNIEEARRYCEETWPQSQFIVVTVGYASQEIIDLLGESTERIEFDEKTFASSLRSKMQELVGRTPAHAEVKPDPELLKRLNELQTRLAEVETRRRDETRAVQQRFEEKAAELSAPAREEQGMRSRWELQRALDELFEADKFGDPGRQRQLMHAILAANETYVRNDVLDRAGSLFLESLAREWTGETSLRRLRAGLISEMQRALRSSTSLNRLYAAAPWVAGVSAGVFCVAWLLAGFFFGQWFITRAFLNGTLWPAQFNSVSVVDNTPFLFKFLSFLCVSSIVLFVPSAAVYAWRRYLLRQRLAYYEKRIRSTYAAPPLAVDPSLIERYPQAR